ncbi:AMP-binding protein [Microbulbifer sp. PAAF003]|uniref:AMP-binding protein n=1 Tax=unclassified Microbulbifer TaxID=2619833 RepID=UPI002B283933|nr:AMP-binding protein [Microbulbifer sp. MKSA007]
MLTINDKFYSKEDFNEQQQSYVSINTINESNAVAVCVEDNFIWLTLCYYLKSKKISAMPIHPSVPKDTAKRMAEKAGCELLIYGDLAGLIELPATNLNKSEAGIIQMSSGTTGEPKCILRSWADIDIEVKSYCQAFSDPDSMTPVVACPVTHSYGLICGVMVALNRGQSPLIISNINPKYLIKKLQSCQRPLLYSSPVMLQGLLRLWPANSKLFAAMTSGSTMPQQVFEQIQARVENLYQQYGCSEAGCISIGQDLSAANDQGKPLPHVEITCGNLDNKQQEIVAYVKTASGIKTVKTQDVGYLSENGRLHFLARMDDTIIVSGLNVYPAEVEDIILEHPQVNDVVVFKIDDQFAGQRVCLQYVASPAIDPSELRQWCSQHLALFQVPQILQPVDEIMRMANSKVNRKQIALNYQQNILTRTNKSSEGKQAERAN